MDLSGAKRYEDDDDELGVEAEEVVFLATEATTLPAEEDILHTYSRTKRPSHHTTPHHTTNSQFNLYRKHERTKED